ncbi:MAG: hypothetical protein ACM3H9_07830 [Rhodospirillaceae bacterium]
MSTGAIGRSALVLATLAVPGVAHAAAGDLDPSFSGDGKVTTPVNAIDGAGSVAIDSEGRIVVAGYTDERIGGTLGHFAVAHYLG